MLDEGLALLTRLWSGEPVLHDGRFYTVRGDHGPGHPEIAPTPFLPAALQQPRIPVWVAGAWPRRAAFRRAAKWDGVVPMRYAQGLGQYLSPTEVGDIVAFIRQHRSGDDPFDVVSSGHTAGEDHDRDAALVRAHQDAGATWWLEDISPWPFGWAWDGPWPVERMQERIRQGPPRL